MADVVTDFADAEFLLGLPADVQRDLARIARTAADLTPLGRIAAGSLLSAVGTAALNATDVEDDDALLAVNAIDLVAAVGQLVRTLLEKD